MNSRVRVTSGDVDNNSKLQHLAAAHPFTRQVDVVLLSDGNKLKDTLVKLETVYVKTEMDLAEVVEQTEQMQVVGSAGTFTALSVNQHEEDTWCIDPRGVLTMHLSSGSYQVLGGGQSLAGKKVKALRALKGIADEYVVSVPLQPSFHKDHVREKRNAAVVAWDERRRGGSAPWQVVYAASDPLETARIAARKNHTFVRTVKCSVSQLQNARVPKAGGQLLKPRPADPDEAEDWDEDIGELFEWVGMAGLGAQRLLANDRVDPYIAVYALPEFCRESTGEVTLLRWTGFLPPAFVQSVIDACCADSEPFAAITCHGLPSAPVAYIPLGKDGTPTGNTSPPRIASADAEDSRCVILSNGRWCMAESISDGDTRWG
ncbi:ribonuclease P 40kDa subunit-domain-containing protein [Mycena amicta]|nr:ribonuclease P 40kDa subunit-domain-containing protein [Mycena amicta]